MAYGFNNNKSKADVYTKTESDNKYRAKTDSYSKTEVKTLLGSGKIVRWSGSVYVSENSYVVSEFSKENAQTIFGTDDMSKVHFISCDAFVPVDIVNGTEIRAWATYPMLLGERWFTMPYIELYDKNDYPWTGQRIFKIFVGNPRRSQNIKFRFVAFVED